MKIFEQWESEVRGYSRIYPTVFRSASNARQVDERGRSYVDFFAGAGVLNFGHNNERMKRAMIAFLEADGVAHSLDMATDVKRDFMQAFVDTILLPRKLSYKMQFVGPTGTNAVEAALKLARRVTGRPSVVAFSHGFHGMTLGALACTANEHFRGAAGVPLGHVYRLPFENSVGGGLDSIAELREILRDPSSGVEAPAAFLVETIQAEGGVNVASEAWLGALRELAREHDALFIVDEIQVGCGRTGSFFSFDGMGLDPDIVCLAKGIGGFGTPLAMNLIKPEHDATWRPGQHTGTFRGQGLSFVAGREALRYFEDDTLMKEVKAKGARIAERLGRLVEEVSSHDLTVRGRGMIQGLDTGDGAFAREVVASCFEGGLLLGACGSGGRVLKLIPPLTISDEDLVEGLDILEAAVKASSEAR